MSSCHQGTQSFGGLIKAQEKVFQHQRPTTPSRRHWIIPFTVFLQDNTVQPFSRDSRGSSFIQLSSVKAPLNPSWQPYSFQYSLDPSRTVFHFQSWEIHSTQFNFNISQLYQFPKRSIQPQGSMQISFQPEELKLLTFHIYRLPFPPWGVFPQLIKTRANLASIVGNWLHVAPQERQLSHVSHENVTQSPNPFQHYLQCLGNFTSLACASPPNAPRRFACLRTRTPLQMRLRHCPPISVLTTPYAFTPPPLPSLCSHGALPTCLRHL
ncbi:hypothetical protein O181_070548 [Austropuccinia psidii MF-1]|uniref:Uncharacterized protein n=1 Tax=Austropuccinia psidii MF-1 TaxID=1389203 RepID=A0A9Q3F438_9BASI|nr:hypothetical protein [Austropuccinia psidii MF-1]